MKIGQYLAKIWTRVLCLLFFDSRCIWSNEWHKYQWPWGKL